MKKNVLLVILLLTVGVFSAQAGIKFGVKAGVNLANASFDKEVVDPSNFTGFQAGVITEFTLPVLGWGFDAALLYSQQGLKFDKTDLEEEIKLNTL
ncbi:PorT family protein, partial [Bacteroidales bacterium OttesenSCG-928-A17]|nr:PorT family protein [Bacteroidales bacterium OttesenSCG-928-A17]